MISIKAILFILLGLYFIGLVFMYQNKRIMRELPEDHSLADMSLFDSLPNQQRKDFFNEITYDFTNKVLALKVLSQLDVYKPISDEKLKEYGVPLKFDQSAFGFKADDQYCEKQREYFVEYPEFVFQEINVVQARQKDAFVTQHAINGFANDIHPTNNPDLPKKLRTAPTTEIRPYVNCFFTNNALYANLRYGKQFSCLSQLSNHIPGSITLSRKDFVADAATDYVKQYADRPQCMSYDKFFPETWHLANKEECDKFFEIFNSETYQKLKQERRIVYIKKITGLHRGEGVQPLTPDEETILREEYENGAKCGVRKDNVLMQHYIYNPLLINGRKFDFRMYMLVASTNPLIAYYHDGNLRVSLGTYSPDSDDKKTLLTNIALNKDIYESAKEGELFDGMDLADLAHHQQWSMERLQEYLLQAGVISDPNWLENYLRPEFKKAMVHLIRFALKSYHKSSSIYELYGVDFMLDTNLNLWFIEANSGPAIKGLPDALIKYIVTMVHDHFKIEFGLLRSRMKRVIQYVNELIAEEGAVVQNENGDVTISNLEQRIQEFEKVNKNYFEKEFDIAPDNTWNKIVDENLEGIDRYQGWITEECL